jgi:hypothetical protein
MGSKQFKIGVWAWALLSLSGVATWAQTQLADEGWGDLGYSKTEAQVEAIPNSLDLESVGSGESPVEPSPEALAASGVTSASIVTSENLTEASAVSNSDSVAVSQVLPDHEALARQETLERSQQGLNKGSNREPKKSREEGRPSGSSRTFGNISTLKNSHGVMTQEAPPVQFYIAPFGGVSTIVGNTTVDASSRFAVGGQAGFLLSSNFLLNIAYTYSEHSLSGPRTGNTIVFGAPQDVYRLKTNHLELGGRLFFLGRESRVRPFFGGGMGWGKSYLNYSTANLQALGYQPGFVKDFTLNQFDAFGELGAEVAITRAISVHAAFRLRGVLGTTTSANSDLDAASYDAAKLAVGNSLRQTASYTLGAGLGIYF